MVSPNSMSIVGYNRSSIQSSPSGTILYPGSDVTHHIFTSIVIRSGLLHDFCIVLRLHQIIVKGFKCFSIRECAMLDSTESCKITPSCVVVISPCRLCPLYAPPPCQVFLKLPHSYQCLPGIPHHGLQSIILAHPHLLYWPFLTTPSFRLVSWMSRFKSRCLVAGLT